MIGVAGARLAPGTSHDRDPLMNKLLTALIALIGFLSAQPANSADVNGWQGAKWGMRPNEVQTALRYPTVPTDMTNSCPEPCRDGAALDINDYDVDGQHFRVRFWFTKLGLHLNTISLYAKPIQEDSGIILYNKIDKLLLKTYGAPQSVIQEGGTMSTTWVLPSTSIELNSNTLDYMTVVYQARTLPGQGKL
jgi:hypothetical protein